jgi:probable F420-dependent oxidoreductase
MKIDTSLHSAGPVDQREAARRAEEAGYDGLWAAEVKHDPFVALTLASTETENIDLGTSIALAFARNPMSLAGTAHDLHAVSGGRLYLGLGTQVKAHITRRFSMPWSRPAARMREYVLAVRAIWACWAEGTALDFEGEFYSHTLMTPMFVPRPHGFGPPKVLLAGVGETMTRTAGEVADGFLCHGFTTERYLREVTVPALRKGRGNGLGDFQLVGLPMRNWKPPSTESGGRSRSTGPLRPIAGSWSSTGGEHWVRSCTRCRSRGSGSTWPPSSTTTS